MTIAWWTRLAPANFSCRASRPQHRAMIRTACHLGSSCSDLNSSSSAGSADELTIWSFTGSREARAPSVLATSSAMAVVRCVASFAVLSPGLGAAAPANNCSSSTRSRSRRCGCEPYVTVCLSEKMSGSFASSSSGMSSATKASWYTLSRCCSLAQTLKRTCSASRTQSGRWDWTTALTVSRWGACRRGSWDSARDDTVISAFRTCRMTCALSLRQCCINTWKPPASRHVLHRAS
mmetsp:Transcript_76615/g.128708  ORF Transcript_76615/g.128708 Transcript_76615/m.128708 type:complete len:235 (-) Transcript_76615:750-1454(-)